MKQSAEKMSRERNPLGVMVVREREYYYNSHLNNNNNYDFACPTRSIGEIDEVESNSFG